MKNKLETEKNDYKKMLQRVLEHSDYEYIRYMTEKVLNKWKGVKK